MFSIVDRYVARTFFSGYLILLVVFIGLIILFDLLINLDEFSENRTLSLGQLAVTLADYYGHNLPLYFSLVGGPVMCFAAAFTVAMMLRNNELTALVAAGMPLWRLALPVLLVAALMIAAWMVNRELLIPHFAHKIARDKDALLGQTSAGVFAVRDDNDSILYARQLHTAEGVLLGVSLVVAEQGPDRPRTLIEADRATWDPSRKVWQLDRGRRIVLRDAPDPSLGGGIEYVPIDSFRFTLNPAELSLRQAAEWAEYLSVGQMNTLLRSANLPNRPSIDRARHSRLTQPLAQTVLLMLALPFFLTREPANVLGAGGRAILVTGAFFATTFLATSMTLEEPWSTFSAWVPIILFGPLAVVQLANVRT